MTIDMSKTLRFRVGNYPPKTPHGAGGAEQPSWQPLNRPQMFSGWKRRRRSRGRNTEEQASTEYTSYMSQFRSSTAKLSGHNVAHGGGPAVTARARVCAASSTVGVELPGRTAFKDEDIKQPPMVDTLDQAFLNAINRIGSSHAASRYLRTIQVPVIFVILLQMPARGGRPFFGGGFRQAAETCFRPGPRVDVLVNKSQGWRRL